MNRKEAEKYFSYEHLPEPLRSVSKPICDAALSLGDVNSIMEAMSIGRDVDGFRNRAEIAVAEEKMIAARKHFEIAQRLMLEAKDCAVRAFIKLD